MPSKYFNQKVCVFIDSQNLHVGIQNLGWALDYKKLFIYLKEKYKAESCFIYIGYIQRNEHLYSELQSYGFKIIFKNTKQFGENRNQIKGNIDVDLTVDAIRKSNDYTLAIFISADGDFIALYDYLFQELSKDLIILIPNIYKYSSFLLKYKDKLRFMNDLKNKLEKV